MQLTYGYILTFLITIHAKATNCFQTNKNPPNIVILYADDLGYNDVSFRGSPEIPTPNIDALASAGIILNRYYAVPLCTPSRASLLTGLYPSHTGLQHSVLMEGEPSGLPLNFEIMPQHLKKLGYVTALIGKWHLGYHTKKHLPINRGFDKFFGFLNGLIDYYDYTVYSTGEHTFWGVDLMEDDKVIKHLRGQYSTELFTDRGIQLVERHNSSQPLFLMMSYNAPHFANEYKPSQAPPHLVEKFKYINDTERRIYAGNVASLDENIGRLFKALAAKNMLDNSVIVFASDNGGPFLDTQFIIGSRGSASNWPLRGEKSHLWEGGVRCLGFIWSPLLGLQHPKTSEQKFHVSDLLPTLYAAAGGDPKDLGNIDGMNMWPHLLTDSPWPRNEIVLNVDQINNHSALIVGDYKLVEGSTPRRLDGWNEISWSGIKINTPLDNWVWKDGCDVKNVLEACGWWLSRFPDDWRANLTVTCNGKIRNHCDSVKKACLFNIIKDPCEHHNLASSYPSRFEYLKRRLDTFKASAAKPLNQPVDRRADPQYHGFAYVPWMD